MHKCLVKYGSFQPIKYADIKATAIRLPSIIFYKQKDLDLKARIVVCPLRHDSQRALPTPKLQIQLILLPSMQPIELMPYIVMSSPSL